MSDWPSLGKLFENKDDHGWMKKTKGQLYSADLSPNRWIKLDLTNFKPPISKI